MDDIEIDYKIKSIISDNRGELTSKYFDEFYKKYGIERKFIIVGTPQ